MAKLRPEQKRSPAKTITREELRKNPLLGTLARLRLKDIKAAREAKKASELDLG